MIKTPKIYFYDVGLVCFLLGVKDAQQVETHPLRGQIFENMVVCDKLKNLYNEGRDNNMFFYRDKGQHEIDIIQEEGEDLLAYEIKLAPAIHPDFYKNLNYFRALFPDQTKSTMVINTGVEENRLPENGHIHFTSLE